MDKKRLKQGWQILRDTMYQNGRKYVYQMTNKLPRRQNIPNNRKIIQMAIKFTSIFHLKAFPKFTQMWIFGSKIYHLVTLVESHFETFRQSFSCPSRSKGYILSTWFL
jgi:hypothetical protein